MKIYIAANIANKFLFSKYRRTSTARKSSFPSGNQSMMPVQDLIIWFCTSKPLLGLKDMEFFFS